LYNFLVTAKPDAWSLPAYEYERDRFGEYTSPALKTRFNNLTADAIEELKSYPVLFAYEGAEKDVRVGYLRRIKERARSVLIEYDFEPNIPAIPFSRIEPIKGRLDIENWEMNRTHWAVKDEDLFEILHSSGLIDETFSNSAGYLAGFSAGLGYAATGPAEVTIVNPDQDAARRIEAVAGPKIPCKWIPKRVQDWVEGGKR